MFIQTQSTPNPESLMFHPGKPVMDIGSADFPNARSALNSPLAKSLFAIDGTTPSLPLFIPFNFMCFLIVFFKIIAGITRVFFGSDFVTVTKSEDASWEFLKPEIFASIMDFYSSGEPLFLDSQAAASKDTAIHDVSSPQFKDLMCFNFNLVKSFFDYLNLLFFLVCLLHSNNLA